MINKDFAMNKDINNKIKEFVKKIQKDGCWLNRYETIFYVDPKHLNVEEDAEMASALEKKFNVKNCICYSIYFYPDEPISTICSYQCSTANYEKIYGERFALTKEEMKSIEKD